MADLMSRIDELMPDAVEIRRFIHSNPELGMKEFKTTEFIRNKLNEYGVEIEDRDLRVGVSAIIRGKTNGQTIALRADIDALPMEETTGLEFASRDPSACHSCGHDIHTACMLLTAKILNERKNELCGNVRILFQPAEETGEGAKYMIEKGAFSWEPVMNELVGIHVGTEIPAGSIGLIKGPSAAGCDIITVTVHGFGGHGARPQNCVDPIVVSAYLIAQLQTLVSREISPFTPAVLTFGTIHGGTVGNVIPESVTFVGTLRTFDPDTRAKLKDAIKRTCISHCESMRARAEVDIIDDVPPLIHDKTIIDDLADAAMKTIGSEKIVWLDQPSTGSDDFAVFLEKIPGVRYIIGTANDDPSSKMGLHNPGTVFDERAIRSGALVTCQYVLDKLSFK